MLLNHAFTGTARSNRCFNTGVRTIYTIAARRTWRGRSVRLPLLLRHDGPPLGLRPSGDTFQAPRGSTHPRRHHPVQCSQVRLLARGNVEPHASAGCAVPGRTGRVYRRVRRRPRTQVWRMDLSEVGAEFGSCGHRWQPLTREFSKPLTREFSKPLTREFSETAHYISPHVL